MKRSMLEAGEGCKQHPNNKLQPGVCSSCLTDKLSKLNNNKSTANDRFPPSPSASSSASPQHFSSSSSNYVPPAYRRRHRRHASDVMVRDSVSYMNSFNAGLKKSKSVAFAPRNRLREREVNRDNRGSKKDGFWSRLLKLAKKDTPSCNPGSRGREGVSHVKGLI